ncbi:hypothetical protein FQZ97_959380 [compost metagenome]
MGAVQPQQVAVGLPRAQGLHPGRGLTGERARQGRGQVDLVAVARGHGLLGALHLGQVVRARFGQGPVRRAGPVRQGEGRGQRGLVHAEPDQRPAGIGRLDGQRGIEGRRGLVGQTAHAPAARLRMGLDPLHGFEHLGQGPGLNDLGGLVEAGPQAVPRHRLRGRVRKIDDGAQGGGKGRSGDAQW